MIRFHFNVMGEPTTAETARTPEVANNVRAMEADLRKKLVGHLEVAAKKAAEVAKRLVENQVKLAALQEQERVLLRQIDLK